FRDSYRLAISEYLFANQDDRLAGRKTFEDLDRTGVVEPGLDGEAFGLVIGDRENGVARFFNHERVGRDERGIRFAFHDDADAGIHAGAELAFWVLQLNFGEHGFGGIIQRLSVTGDGAVK